MGEIYYTIKANDNVIVRDVKAEYVPIIIKCFLAEWFADYSLRLSVEAQRLSVEAQECPSRACPNMEG